MPADAADAILVDANLVIWAHHEGFTQHTPARSWWADALSTTPLVGVPWPTVLAFLRVSTHPHALPRPLAIDVAWAAARGWLTRPNVRCPVPTERHRSILEELLVAGQAAGTHTTDAHLAALAIEWGLELQSSDRDFARYPGLRWRDPLQERIPHA